MNKTLSKLFNDLNNINATQKQVLNKIIDLGIQTNNNQLAMKYIDIAENFYPDEPEILYKKLLIYIFLEPDKIYYIFDKLNENFISYYKGLYYFAKEEYEKAYKILPINNSETLIYKEISRSLKDKDNNIDFSKYKNKIYKTPEFYQQVTQILDKHGLYDLMYNWYLFGKKNFDYQNNKQIYFYLELINGKYNLIYNKFDKLKNIINDLNLINSKDVSLKILTNYYFGAIKDFNKIWKIEKNFNKNIINFVDTIQIPSLINLSSLKKGNKILLIADQGFGDNIMNYRYLRKFIDDNQDLNITVIVYKELYELFFNNLPKNIKILKYLNEKDMKYIQNNYFKYKYKIFLYKLPILYNFSLNDIKELGIKYIFNNIKDYHIKSDKPVIAINWKTESRNMDAVLKSFKLEKFLEYININKLKEKYNIISIQKNSNLQEKNILKKYQIKDYDKELTNFMTTALILNNVEILFTNDTSVLHLAGALGKKVKLYLNKHYDWKFINIEDYKKHYLYKDLTIIRTKNLIGKNK